MTLHTYIRNPLIDVKTRPLIISLFISAPLFRSIVTYKTLSKQLLIAHFILYTEKYAKEVKTLYNQNMLINFFGLRAAALSQMLTNNEIQKPLCILTICS